MEPTLIPIPVNAPGVLTFNYQRDAIWLLEQAVMLAVPLLFLLTGWGAKLRDWCNGLTGGRGYLTLILFAVIYLAIAALAVLPAAWWREIAHRAAWGAPTRPLGDWLAARGLTLLLQIVGIALLAWAPLALLKRLPDWWWAPAGALVALAMYVGIVASQVWLPTLTKAVTPFPEGAARAQMDALAARCGLEDVPIFVGGVEFGAAAVGLGPFGQIHVASSHIDEMRLNGVDEEFVTMFAHELRHYMHDNWWPALAAIAVVAFGGALLVHLVGSAAIGGGRFGVESLTDAAALPLIVLILSFYGVFMVKPGMNAFQRGHELEADRFALEATHLNEVQARAQARSAAAASRTRVVEHYWFYELFRATHPSDADRVRLANTWRPWERGETGKYAHICAPNAE